MVQKYKAWVEQPWRISHKELGVDEVIQDAQDLGVNTISAISSGNCVDAILQGVKEKGSRENI